MATKLSETEAIVAVDRALSSVEDQEARHRVLAWANARFGHPTVTANLGHPTVPPRSLDTPAAKSNLENAHKIAPAAALWLRRNGIASDDKLAKIFSVDHSQIDVVADEVPGSSTKSKMRSVFLLQGVASCLATGEFRFDDASIRAMCQQYGAYDGTNFSKHLKAIDTEVSGGKDTGYSLLPKGQKAAAELVKSMISQ